MRVGVIAKFEAIVSPHFQGIDAVVDFTELVEFFFIYETHRRNFLIAQSGQEFRGHLFDFRAGHEVRGCGGKIVDGDGDGAVRRSLGQARASQRREAKLIGPRN